LQPGRAGHKFDKARMEVQLSRLREKRQQVDLPEPGIKAIQGLEDRMCIGLVTRHGDVARLSQRTPES
jgi:hypothetical protein